jgi:hypothetical protein
MDYLVSNYLIENILIGKPKKQGEYFVSKVKYSDEYQKSHKLDLIIQLPNMKLVNDITVLANVELEFINKQKYSNKVYDFLSAVDEFVLGNICKNSEEWFNKKIPIEKLNTMYNKNIKAPKSSDCNCTMNFKLSKENLSLIDHRKNELSLSEYKKDLTVECICKLKYIIFSKDKCFPVWELIVLKLNKRVNRVPKYGFIEEPEVEEEDNSDNDIAEIDYSFFS